MLRTLLVFGVLVIGIVVVRSSGRQNGPRVTRVDARVVAEVDLARQRAGFPVVAPVDLPAAWAPTSATYTSSSSVVAGRPLLHLGYLTPAGTYAGLEESDVDVTAALDPTDGSSPRPAGTSVVAGRTFDVRLARDGTTTLTGRIGVAVVGVTGGASQGDLESLLASLR